MNDSNWYRGWKITFSPKRPVTGLYVAEQNGVTINAGTRSALRRMIDTKIYLKEEDERSRTNQ